MDDSVSIKGTLETFNLRELLQMLAFNQKVGTLLLATDQGPRTVHVDRGGVAFVAGDAAASRALLRVVRRRGLIPEDRLERALDIHANSGDFLGDVLDEMGLFDAEMRKAACDEAVGESFLDLQLGCITHFEFADGKALAPDGQEGAPIEPRMVVETLLLDLTRKMDQWSVLGETVTTFEEIYEGTGVSVDIAEALAEEEVDTALADRLVPYVNGVRTLNQVVEDSDVDRLTVAQVAAALIQGGGIRLVATEDLVARADDFVSRGEARSALPLLRLAVEREDAAPDARLRLATALEASIGPDDADERRREAAEELEFYAELTDEAQPLQVFDALQRALDLRDGDPAASMRLCEYYLHHRPWLHDRKDAAVDALRGLIHGAVTAGRPAEAAEHLEQFIRAGDMPRSDLVTLADLYAAGNRQTQAADALFQRAEDLLAGGRTGEGLELLERTLRLDPSRPDARARLHAVEGVDRRRRQAKRLIVLGTLIALILAGAGVAWWLHNQATGKALNTAYETARTRVDGAAVRIRTAVAAFEEHVERAREADEVDPALATAPDTLLQAVHVEREAVEPALDAYSSEVLAATATSHGQMHADRYDRLKSTLERAAAGADAAILRARELGQRSLKAGEDHHAGGRFEDAFRELRAARNLAFDNAGQRDRARQLLGHVQTYRREFAEAHARVEALRTAGDVAGTYRAAVRLIQGMLDSDLTRRVRVPVDVVTEPPGAQVWIGGADTGMRTPCVVGYTPFEPTDLLLRTPGREPRAFELPDYEAIRYESEKTLAWSPRVRATLPEGPLWIIEGSFRALWESERVPVVLRADGSALHSVDAAEATLSVPRTFPSHLAAHSGGTIAGNVEWRILGRHSLAVRPRDVAAWEAQALGNLRRPPVAVEGVVVVVDEAGRVYGLTLNDGSEIWHRDLGAPPTQRLRLSDLGILAATEFGTVISIDPRTGEPKVLSAGGGGFTLALPFGDGVAILGGAARELRIVGPGSDGSPAGTASPEAGRTPWAAREGIAWIEADGVRWLGAGTTEPVRVPGLGADVRSVAGDGAELYAIDAAGILRAVRIDEPAKTLWQTDLGAGVASPPLPLGGEVYVLVKEGLAAVAR